VARALAACRTAEAYPSNNWVLLARACALLEAPAGPPRAAAAARVGECLARWITPAGGFMDGPPRPEGGPASTPITYHAKFLLVLLVLRLGAPDSCTEAGPALARGLAWLLAFTDESGRAGGFGRSSHALYGYGCLLALGAHGLRAGDERSRRAWAVGCRRLRLQLESVRRDDGLLSITLNPATGAAGGWDDYMHLLVYNAWTAGCSPGCSRCRPSGPRRRRCPSPTPRRSGAAPSSSPSTSAPACSRRAARAGWPASRSRASRCRASATATRTCATAARCPSTS
jgi:hypothetical protein